MQRNHDADAVARKLSELCSSLEQHDLLYTARHTRDSTQHRTDLVREIQALEASLDRSNDQQVPVGVTLHLATT